MKPTGALPLIISAVVRNRLRVHLTFGSYSVELSFFFFFLVALRWCLWMGLFNFGEFCCAIVSLFFSFFFWNLYTCFLFCYFSYFIFLSGPRVWQCLTLHILYISLLHSFFFFLLILVLSLLLHTFFSIRFCCFI